MKKYSYNVEFLVDADISEKGRNRIGESLHNFILENYAPEYVYVTQDEVVPLHDDEVENFKKLAGY